MLAICQLFGGFAKPDRNIPIHLTHSWNLFKCETPTTTDITVVTDETIVIEAKILT